jgi:5,10-methylenetetrahydromethanopterin reductase
MPSSFVTNMRKPRLCITIALVTTTPVTTNGDRFGVRWGLAGGVALSTVDEVREAAIWAESSGFDSLWVSHGTAVDPIVALAAVAADVPNISEVGTSVVPLYGRHPVGLAQQAMTAQSALGGRFTLGVGPSHARQVEGALGMSWDRPFGFTREFIDGLQPLLAGEAANVDGTQVTTHAEVNIDAPATPILLAALGPKMLDFAGRRVDGTTLGQCGPTTIATHIVPTLHTAAESAGRPIPRVMALVRICVTDDHAGAYALAQEVGSFYKDLPSYAAVLAKEGLADPADLHLIGSSDKVLDGLAAYAAAGVTDLRIEVVAHNEDARAGTRDALAAHLR